MLAILTALICTAFAASTDLPTITAVGSKFFYSNGTQYYIKGLQYQHQARHHS